MPRYTPNTEQVLVRMSKSLRRRLAREARRLTVSEPEAARLILNEHLPPDPGRRDRNQLTIGDTAP
jgi:hypothetical protein